MQRILHELVEGFKPLLPSALPPARLQHELEEICNLPAAEIAAEEAIKDGTTIPDFEPADLLVLAQLLKDTPEEEEKKRITRVIAEREEARERGEKALREKMQDYRAANESIEKAESTTQSVEPISLEESQKFFASLMSKETTEPSLPSDDFT